MILTFEVRGKAEPQGSAKAFIPKGWSRAVVTSDNPKLKAWRRLVAIVALDAMRRAGWTCVEQGAVTIQATVYLPRPKALKASASCVHTTRPDADKVARGLLDSLSGVVYRDDGQVNRLVVTKQYAGFREEPRVEVTVYPSEEMV